MCIALALAQKSAVRDRLGGRLYVLNGSDDAYLYLLNLTFARLAMIIGDLVEGFVEFVFQEYFGPLY